MKTLLLVADAWAPQINGAARVAEQHAREIEALGWRVEVIHTAQFVNIPLLFSPDIRLALLAGGKVRRRIAEGGFDAVHIVAEGPLGLAARRACVRRGVPFTTWYHTRFDLYLGAYLAKLLVPPTTAFLRWFHNAAARTMVSTHTLKHMLEAEGHTNVVVVPLGVDTARFQRSATPKEFPRPVFLYFSRVAPEKSPEEFLKLDLPGTKLVVGDGPLRRELERKYPEATFVGFKVGQELVEHISGADVMVFPSRTETFGLVQLEAMACGVPVAAHRVLGPQDVVTEGKDGYLTNEQGDNLRECVLKCLQLNPADCRAKAEQYSWQNSAREFANQLVLIT